MWDNVHLGVNEIQYSGPYFKEEQTKAREIIVTFLRSYSGKERK